MNKTIEQLIESLDTIPFLFVGSGLSRRYYNLPDWIGLLKVMADKLKQDSFAFRSYEDRASFENSPYGINPKIASLIEEDFNKEWFRNPEIRSLDGAYTEKVENGCSPFKAELSYYLKQKSVLCPELKDEVTLLNNIAKKSIAGIITTNYDLFFETYLSQYTIYIGQQALLFSQLQGIAEVYKIHGSLNDPQSIVINEKDYKEFKEKREYLAAKLYTDTIKYKRGYGISYKSLLNKDTLNDLIAKADALDSKKYTEESWNKFTPALAGAKEVANTNGVSQKKIDEAIASLQAAMDALVEKPAETKPEEPKKDDTKKDETKKDETKKDNVKTGDMTNILPFAALMGLACVAFIFLKKKKV